MNIRIIFCFSLLYMPTVYMMELEKKDLPKAKLPISICNNLNRVCSNTTILDVSCNQFTTGKFPLGKILNECPLLVTCKANATQISEASLSGLSNVHEHLKNLDLSNNTLTCFNIGRLLNKCVNLKNVNLQDNATLKHIIWQESDISLLKNQIYPVINLKNTALTLKSKLLLCRKYNEHYFCPNDNLHAINVILAISFGVFLLGSVILVNLIDNHQELVWWRWPMLAGSILIGCLGQRTLSAKVKQVALEKLIF